MCAAHGRPQANSQLHCSLPASHQHCVRRTCRCDAVRKDGAGRCRRLGDVQEAVACVGGVGGGGVSGVRHMLGTAGSIDCMQEAVACAGRKEGELLQ